MANDLVGVANELFVRLTAADTMVVSIDMDGNDR